MIQRRIKKIIMSEYDLKTDPLTLNRLRKIAKGIIDTGKADRELALQTYTYFKDKVDSDEDNDQGTCKKCMIDCLKLMQSSKAQATKLVVDLIKREAAPKNSKTEVPEGDLTFDDLLKQLEDQDDG
tara:strand:- start:1977 stop:2354 length:378 start_codon:yes stop_codon:yes gene_type:complete